MSKIAKVLRTVRTATVVAMTLTVLAASVAVAQLPKPRPWSGPGSWVEFAISLFGQEYSLCLARLEACYDSCARQASDLWREDDEVDFDAALSFFLHCRDSCPLCNNIDITEALIEAMSGGTG